MAVFCTPDPLTLSTGAGAPVHGSGRVGLSPTEARKMSASVGSLVATVPEVLADLSGAIADEVRRELSDSELVRRIWNSVRDLRDVHRVPEEAMANIEPKSWRDRALKAGEQCASRQSVAEVLPAHDRGNW